MSVTTYTYNLVLFVDDEEKTRKYFTRLFGDKFRIVCAEDGQKALEIFEKYHESFGVVISDQRMPNMTGSEFLGKIAKIKPSTIRILSTAYADLDAATEAVNKGGIYKYVTKPWEIGELEVTLMRAMELYILQRERDYLLKQKLTSIQAIAYSDRILSIATLAVFQQEDLKNINRALSMLAQLNEACEEHIENQAHTFDQSGWKELHKKHIEFLTAIKDRLKKEKLQGKELDFVDSVSVKKVITPLLEKLSSYQWKDGKDKLEATWPGSRKDVQGEVLPLLNALDQMNLGDERIIVTEVEKGIELHIPVKPLAEILTPFLSAEKEGLTQPSLSLVAALFRLANVGASFELFPEAGGLLLRLRVLLDQNNTDDNTNIGWDSLVTSLIGNELFWSRVDKSQSG